MNYKRKIVSTLVIVGATLTVCAVLSVMGVGTKDNTSSPKNGIEIPRAENTTYPPEASEDELSQMLDIAEKGYNAVKENDIDRILQYTDADIFQLIDAGNDYDKTSFTNSLDVETLKSGDMDFYDVERLRADRANCAILNGAIDIYAAEEKPKKRFSSTCSLVEDAYHVYFQFTGEGNAEAHPLPTYFLVKINGEWKLDVVLWNYKKTLDEEYYFLSDIGNMPDFFPNKEAQREFEKKIIVECY